MKEIPEVKFPSIHDFETKNIHEPLVSLKELGFIVEPEYFQMQLPGSFNDIYVRETVAKMLINTQKMLPDNIKFKIYDGYRTIETQEYLWNEYRKKVVNENMGKNLSEDEIDFLTSFFVSKPSYNINKPCLHNTGGAIDLTLIDKNGNELNMGTAFDDFTNKAWTNHFEKYSENEEIKNNRRLLYWTMINAGFTNLPSEWWHYDYGTKFWGYFKNEIALYSGIPDNNYKI